MNKARTEAIIQKYTGAVVNSLKNITTDLSEESTETWFVEQT